MSELKQEICPFCGSENISAGEVLSFLQEYQDHQGVTCTQSKCEDCGALGPEAVLADGEVDYGDVKAITAWNRRGKLHALLRDFQALAHDNEYALGDRLQRISSRITAVLNGGALDEFTPHLPRIVEQSFDIEAARAAASGRAQPEANTDAKDAERYRWLKSKAHTQQAMDRWQGDMWWISVEDPKQKGIDAAIDAARQAKEKE